MKKSIFKLSALIFAVSVIISIFAVTVSATQPLSVYVYDGAELLTEQQYEEINAKAAELSYKYKCAVHIVTTDDPEVNENNIQQHAEDLYLYNSIFGYGDGRDGFMLTVDRHTRCYWLLAYGSYGNYALTDYGKDEMAKRFTDNFAADDWYGGFADYLSYAEEVFAAAENGKPIDIYKKEKSDMGAKPYAVAAVIGVITALIVCSILKGKMNTAVYSGIADKYVDNTKSDIYYRDHKFAFSTVTRTKIEKSSDGQGTTVNSRGFSGKGGKF